MPLRPVGWRLCILLTVIFSAGCGLNKTVEKSPPDGVPENAILVSGQLYMVSLSEDATGCMMYRPYSPTGSVVAAIFYRTADGRFVLNKAESACK